MDNGQPPSKMRVHWTTLVHLASPLKAGTCGKNGHQMDTMDNLYTVSIIGSTFEDVHFDEKRGVAPLSRQPPPTLRPYRPLEDTREAGIAIRPSKPSDSEGF